MELPVKRKIVSQADSSYLRSTTNTQGATTNGQIKVKASINSIAQVRARPISGIESPVVRSRSPLRVSPPRSIRSPSPIRTTKSALSSPIDPPRSANGYTTTSSTLRVSAKTTIAKRASASRVASPTPSQPATIRAVASVYSLPTTPIQKPSPPTPLSMTSLAPAPSTSSHHLRHNSDTSSISTRSPSGSSLGTHDDSRAGDVMGGRSSPISAVRVKSKVSSLAIASSPISGPSLPSSLQAGSGSTMGRKTSLSSTVGRTRARTSSISSAVSTPAGPTHRSTPSIGRATVKATTNIHMNHYQPFPIPSLPAPPAPDAIENILSRSPPKFAKSPPGSPLMSIFPRPRSDTVGTTRPEHSTSIPDGMSGLGLEDPEKRRSPSPDAQLDPQSEARSNRKIADLEITNKSLMAINATLEATKSRQAKEIRDLRRKLRETRLILPPRAFNALRSTEASSTEQLPLEGAPAPASLVDEEDDDEDEEEPDPDPLFDRITSMVDAMIGHAKDAIKRVNEPDDVDAGMKVLSAAEVQRYHGEDTDTTDTETNDGHDIHEHDPSESEAEIDESLAEIERRLMRKRGSPPRVMITAESPALSSGSFSWPSPTRPAHSPS